MRIVWKDEMTELERTVKALGKVPQKCATRAAGKGATVTRRAIRQEIPEGLTGNLRRYLKRDGERSRYKGKKVYRIGIAGGAEANSIFQKPIKDPGAFGGKRKYAYYPASVNFGFPTRRIRNGKSFVEGQHFIERGVLASTEESKEVMVKVFKEEVKKEFLKTHGS